MPSRAVKHRSFKGIYLWTITAGLFLWAAELGAATILITVPGQDEPVVKSCSTALDAACPSRPFVGEDIHYINQTGQPQIPWAMVNLLLTPEADLQTIRATTVKAHYTPSSGRWEIGPRLPLKTRNSDGSEYVLWPESVNQETGKNTSIYQTNAFWPADTVRVLNTGQMRTYKLARVAVPLARYNPVSGKIQLLKDIEIALDYESEKIAAVGMPSVRERRRDFIGRKMTAPLATNFAAMAEKYDPQAAVAASEGGAAPAGSEDPLAGYTIITTNYIVANSTALADFVAHKQQLYYDVQVITETDFGGGTGDIAAEYIRAWLQAHYLNDNIKYVLLIGDPRPDTGAVPMKMTVPMPDETDELVRTAPTDFYYAELTGDWDVDNDGLYGEKADDFGGWETDYEVIVGRIPYYQEDGGIPALDSILQKTISYECQVGSSISWRKNCLLPMSPLDGNVLSYDLGEAIKDNFLVPNGWGYFRIYDEDYGLMPPPEDTPCIKENTIAAWQSPPYYGLVCWQCHGGPTGSIEIIDSSDVYLLNNNYPSATFQASCLHAHPETTNNLAYSLLRHGGIATCGATRVSWYDGNFDYEDWGSISGMEYEYAERIVDSGMSFGDALMDLKQAVDIGPHGEDWWPNILVFNLYGDPTVALEPKVIMPTIAPPSGSYYPDVTAEASYIDENYTIHYTTDGSDPELTDPVYTGPITFTEDTTFKVRAFSDDFPVIRVDILERYHTSSTYIEPDFTGWALRSQSSITVNGVTVTKSSGTYRDYLRTIPGGAPGETLYQDTCYDIDGNGLSFTVSGLAPSTSYRVSLYCYDYDPGDGDHIEIAWSGNGVYMFTSIYDENVLPVSMDDYKDTAIVTSDAGGVIVFTSAKGPECNSTTSYWANLSALEIEPIYSAVATANYTVLPDMLYVDDNAPGDPGPGNPLVSDPLEDGSAEHPFDAVQEAIDYSFSGVTIILEEGTYTGTGNRNITFNGKNIILRSTDPTDQLVVENTVIDCQGGGRGFSLQNGENSSAKLQGLTITNGTGNGGGIYCLNSSPVIEDCRILNGSGGTHGGAVFLDNADPILRRCRMSGCNSSYGGGLYAKNNSTPILENCLVANNTAAYGGGLCFLSSTVTLRHLTVANNTATYNNGGGAYLSGGSSIWENCIVWGNTATNGPSLYLVLFSTAFLQYCDIQGGPSGIYTINSGNYTWDIGCHNQNPLFVNPAGGDYHLQSSAGHWDEATQTWVMDGQTSPVIDTGHPGMALGNEELAPDNKRLNPGAYGGTGYASLTPEGWSLLCDANNDAVVDLNDFALLANLWCETGVQPCDYDRNGDVSVTDLCELAEEWLLNAN
ncbi:MAG: chitobiase/beta-hexosaminidase C-terminal domain-containing protein [Sedimentisphaerales bacterium]|nr:chitobiase/beta-hexosaminidase C-terminal domain-containing protein [Sedimentisphaerales bacterium]